jgi:anhydro-N-acetylmuramic acid kinase
MAAGGQGAPLVPYVDYLLFRHPDKTRVAQNIGGIANLAVISGKAGAEELLAFDTGPGNMVIDALMERFTNGEMTYDRDGHWAAAGTVSPALLTDLLADPYYAATPPKTTGREYYGLEYVESLLQKGEALALTPQDLVATATMLTVESIARAYEEWVIPRWGLDEVILGGGGALNPTMRRWLTERLPEVTVTDHAHFGIPNEAKEAIAFAVLGYAAIHGATNNVPSATGAHGAVVMGKIVPGANWSPGSSTFQM